MFVCLCVRVCVCVCARARACERVCVQVNDLKSGRVDLATLDGLAISTGMSVPKSLNRNHKI